MPPETDPIEPDPVLTNPQNWASRSHQDLYNSVHWNNDPGRAGEVGHEWTKYGTELTESARVITDQIAASESKWTGDAAEGARAAMKKLSEWITETASTAAEVGNKVAEQGRVMETARAQMPEVVQFDWNKAAAALSQPGTPAFVAASIDIAAANTASRAAHDQAVAVMTNMENSSRQIDSSTPAFKAPFNPVTGQVEEPVLAMRMASGAPTLGGADGLMSTQTASATTSAPPAPAGGAGAPPPAGMPQQGGGGGGYQPAAAAVPSFSNVAAYQPPPLSNQDTTAAASYAPPQNPPSYTPQFPGGTTHTGGSNYQPQFPQGGAPYPGMGPNGMPRPNTNVPKPPTPNLTNPNTYNPKDLPKGMTPPVTGGGGGGGGGAAAAAAAAAKGGFGGGAGGPGGGNAMQAGGSTGVVGNQGGPRPGVPMGMPGAPGAAGAAGMGGAPMGGAPAGGRGEEDKEHRSASYLMGGDLFEVPGENLPPSVIGGAKTKKAKGADQA